LYAASRGATVTAFECDPAALASLHLNLDLNPGLAKRIELVEAALGEKDGTAMLHAESFGFSDSSLHPSVDRGRKRVLREQRVEVSVIDSFRVFAQAGWLDDPGALVKIDIEGGEYAVLQRLAPLLTRARASLYVSFHPFELVGANAAETARLRQQAAERWSEWLSGFDWWTATDRRIVPVPDRQAVVQQAATGAAGEALLFTRNRTFDE